MATSELLQKINSQKALSAHKAPPGDAPACADEVVAYSSNHQL